MKKMLEGMEPSNRTTTSDSTTNTLYTTSVQSQEGKCCISLENAPVESTDDNVVNPLEFTEINNGCNINLLQRCEGRDKVNESNAYGDNRRSACDQQSDGGAEIVKKHRKKSRKKRNKSIEVVNLSVEQIQVLHPQRKIIVRGKDWKRAKVPATSETSKHKRSVEVLSNIDVSGALTEHSASRDWPQLKDSSTDKRPFESDVVVDPTVTYVCSEPVMVEYVSERSSCEKTPSVTETVMVEDSFVDNKVADFEFKSVYTENDMETNFETEDGKVDFINNLESEVSASVQELSIDIVPLCDNIGSTLSQSSSGYHEQLESKCANCEEGYSSSQDIDESELPQTLPIDLNAINEDSLKSSKVRDKINRIVGNRIHLSNISASIEDPVGIIISEDSTPRSWESHSKNKSPSQECDNVWQEYLHQVYHDQSDESQDVDFVLNLNLKPEHISLTYISDSSSSPSRVVAIEHTKAPTLTLDSKNSCTVTKNIPNITINNCSVSLDSESDEEVYGYSRKKEQKRALNKSRKSWSL